MGTRGMGCTGKSLNCFGISPRVCEAGCAAVSDDDFDLSAEYETAVGKLTGIQKSKLLEYTGALGVDVVRMAIDRAIQNGARSFMRAQKDGVDDA
ncbi:MAG: hypothetical protein VB096_09590 [Pseudoflavonifractor sp.]|nr:hypothetical protein [Pseudoflavonifractor sp.]